jgi:lysyl-tRNA synthetase class 2
VLLRAYTGAAPLTGVVRVSLNLAPGGGEQAYEAYRPRWALRHLMYERRAELPRVIAAAAYAEGLRLTAARSARALRTAPRARLRA